MALQTGMLPFHVGIREAKLMRSEMSRHVDSAAKLKADPKVLDSRGDRGSGEEVTVSFGFLLKLDWIPQMH